MSMVDLALVHCPSHKFCTAWISVVVPATLGSYVAQEGIVDMVLRNRKLVEVMVEDVVFVALVAVLSADRFME